MSNEAKRIEKLQREISNIRVSMVNPDRFSVSWIRNHLHYHIWVNAKGVFGADLGVNQCPLYVNPPPGIARGQYGYFDTKSLNPFTKANDEMIAFVLTHAIPAQVAAELAKRDERIAEERERHRLNRRKEVIAGFAGEMHDFLLRAENDDYTPYEADQVRETLISRIQVAINAEENIPDDER